MAFSGDACCDEQACFEHAPGARRPRAERTVEAHSDVRLRRLAETVSGSAAQIG